MIRCPTCGTFLHVSLHGGRNDIPRVSPVMILEYECATGHKWVPVMTTSPTTPQSSETVWTMSLLPP